LSEVRTAASGIEAVAVDEATEEHARAEIELVSAIFARRRRRREYGLKRSVIGGSSGFERERFFLDCFHSHRESSCSAIEVWDAGMMTGNGEGDIEATGVGGESGTMRRVLAATLTCEDHLLKAIRILSEVMQLSGNSRSLSEGGVVGLGAFCEIAR